MLRNAKSLLFVCSGNIIRSPLASVLLRQHLRDAGAIINSAGLLAKTGAQADPTAVIAARELGIALDDHRSSALTAKMVEENDVIIVMDHLNEAVLLTRFPQAAPKTLLLGACCVASGRSKPKEILDPYGRGLAELRKCYGDVRSYVGTLSEWLGK
jgi:protein-tyrosine phosphatase